MNLVQKKIQQPVGIESLGNGQYRLMNRRFHTNLDDLYGRYQIEEDGRVISSGVIENFSVNAQESKVVTIADQLQRITPGAEYFIRFSFRTLTDTPWAKAGYEVASEQFKLADSAKPLFKAKEGLLNWVENADTYVVNGENFVATFSKKEGTLSAYILNNVPMISKGIELNLFRAPIDNDKGQSEDWKRKGLYNMTLEAGKWAVRQENGHVILQIENTYRGKSGFDYTTNMEYRVAADGSILVNSMIIPAIKGEIIPRVGYRMELPQGFERMRWYGRGPIENYVDRKDAAYVGVYDELVSDQWVNYIKSQEMGSREELRWISVTNPDGMGFVFVSGGRMGANALHVRAQDMVDPSDLNKLIHKYEVPLRKETILSLDAYNRPLGNASCGPVPLQKYELYSQPVAFSFMMLPLERSYTTPELVEKARVQMPVSMPVMIERDKKGMLSLTTQTPEATIYYKVNGGKEQVYSEPFEWTPSGKIEAYAFSKASGKSIITTVQLPVYVDRSAWKVVSVSSQNEGEEAWMAIDGDANTIWHSRWSKDEAKAPHEIVVDMAALLELDQFIYQPRNSENGRIKAYELYFSKDGKTWGTKIGGTFNNSSAPQVVKLEKPVQARYFKLIGLSEVNGNNWASAAELDVNATKRL